MKFTVKHLVVLGVLVSILGGAAAFSFMPQKQKRKVVALHKPRRNDVSDLVTYNVMPSKSVPIDKLDPFLFLNHHGPQVYPPNNNGMPFGPHPHKGFETVTFILEGDILHQDNSGHKSVIESGGIQWMTAGKGIVHSEVSSEDFKKHGGKVEILQLWINLPAKHKGVDPGYVGLQKEDIPTIEKDNGRVKLNLISGSWENEKAPIQNLTNVFMSTIEMEKNGELSLSVDPAREIFLYVVRGNVNINNETAGTMTLVEFAAEGESVVLEATENSLILFGHATPTNEPVVARGPFVMNSQEEIEQANRDYRAGKFGRGIVEE